MAYSKKLGQKFCDILATGNFTIEDVCLQCGIVKQTFYNWKANPKLDFLDLLEIAEEKRMDSLKEKAISGLAKLIDIYEYDEIKREFEAGPDGKLKPVKTISTKKKVMPSQTAISFVLTNQDAKRWKNRNNVDHTNDGGAFDFGSFLMDPDALPPEPGSEEIPETLDIEQTTEPAGPWNNTP